MPEITLYDDKSLFQRIAQGDETAFKNLFDKYKTKIYFFILHIVEVEAEAEEITQDVFLRIWVSKNALAKVEDPDNYLFIMARNRSLDFIQKRAKERKMKAGILANTNPEQNVTEEDFDFRQSKQLIDEAVSKLPKQQQLVYRLSKEQGLSRQQIAEQLELSENTIKNHLAEAIRSIKEFLREHGDLAILLIIWRSL